MLHYEELQKYLEDINQLVQELFKKLIEEMPELFAEGEKQNEK